MEAQRERNQLDSITTKLLFNQPAFLLKMHQMSEVSDPSDPSETDEPFQDLDRHLPVANQAEYMDEPLELEFAQGRGFPRNSSDEVAHQSAHYSFS